MRVIEDPDILKITAAVERMDLHAENLADLDPRPD
jgi:hypothetical protein